MRDTSFDREYGAQTIRGAIHHLIYIIHTLIF